jgi:hypothetical protein
MHRIPCCELIAISIQNKMQEMNEIIYRPEFSEVLGRDPPNEYFIQYFQCKSWFHESCMECTGKGKLICITVEIYASDRLFKISAVLNV